MFPFGAIVLTRFPFTDLSGDKRRPALVVSRGNERGGDVVVCFITSVRRHDRHCVDIEATPTTGLKVPSAVRLDKIATLNTTVVSGWLGMAGTDWLAAQALRFWQVFGFER